MEPNAAPEELIRSLLASDSPQDRQRALALVKDHYRPILNTEFHERFPELPELEFVACWHRVIEQLARLVEQRPFDPKRSLHKWLRLTVLEEPLKGLPA